jgi:DNA-binding CsgD family transcriptional regulator
MSKLTTIKHSNYQPVLQYNQQNAERIANLCAPLKDCFGIDTFAYSRALDDGKYLLITNNLLMLEIITTNDFYYRTPHFKSMIQQFCRHETLKQYWPGEEDDSISAFKARGSTYKGFYRTRERDGTLEAAVFAYNHSQTQLPEFFQNHNQILDDFVTHFLTLGADLCDVTDTSKLGISENMLAMYSKVDEVFVNSTPWQRRIEQFNGQMDSIIRHEMNETAKAYSITPRELECLSYFTTGMSAKEIARTIDASPRTVEQHIANIRMKTGCHTKNELAQWFKDKFKHVLNCTPSPVST